MVFVALSHLLGLVMFAKGNMISDTFPSLLEQLSALRISHLLPSFPSGHLSPSPLLQVRAHRKALVSVDSHHIDSMSSFKLNCLEETKFV